MNVERHCDLGAERSVVGSVMLDPAVIDLLEDLDPGEFYFPALACVFTTMKRLRRNGQPIDLITLRGELVRMGDLDRAGGDEGLLAITEMIPTAEHVEGYVRTIRSHASLRRLFASCSRTLSHRGKAIEDPQTFLDERAGELVSIATEAHGDDSVERVGEVMPRVKAQLRERQERGGVAGLSTGFGSLDRMLAGMMPGQLIVIAGRPGMGKSALAQAIILQAVLEDAPGLIFSLEMTAEEWTHRMVMSHASIDGGRARRGLLNQGEWSRFNLAESRIGRAPLFIDATPGLTPEQLRARARRTHARERLRLIVVDYVQLMGSSDPKKSTVDRVSDASRALKGLAKELEIPIIAIAQLSREVERRGGDKRPIESDLRESGQLEQDADVIAFVYREVMYHPKKADPRAAEIIVRKQRMGPTGTVKAQFRAEFTRFEDYDPGEFEDEQRKLGGARGI